MRYRKIDPRMWRDDRFRALSDDARLAWVLLLTGPQTTTVPGLYCAGMGQLAEEIGWALERFQHAFAECEARGMVRRDLATRLIWIPNAIKYDLPRNPNQLRSWRQHLRELPKSRLLAEAMASAHRHIAKINPEIADICGLFPKQSEVVCETNPVCLPNNAGEVVCETNPVCLPNNAVPASVPASVPVLDPLFLSRASSRPMDLFSLDQDLPENAPVDSPVQDRKPRRARRATPAQLPEDRARDLAPAVEALRASLAAWRPECRELRATLEQCARSWGLDLDKLERIDGVSVTRMVAVLRWLATDPGDSADFWRANIRSGQKLRKHWDRLEHDSISKEDRAIAEFVNRHSQKGANP